MTFGALYGVFDEIKKAEPGQKHLQPHLLQHNYNDVPSQTIDRQTGVGRGAKNSKQNRPENGIRFSLK